MRILFILYILFNSFAVSAQFLDSIRLAILTPPKFSYRFDSRNSFISTSRARIDGVKIGVEFDRVFRVGGGLHWLDTEIKKDMKLYKNGSVSDTVTGLLKLRYFSYYVEYVFYRTNKWELSLPIMLGGGNSFLQYKNADAKINSRKKFCIVYETNISGHYKVVPWAGIGLGIGYRLMFLGNKAFGQNFNSPIYILKFKIFFADLFRAITGKTLPTLKTEDILKGQ